MLLMQKCTLYAMYVSSSSTALNAYLAFNVDYTLVPHRYAEK